MTPLNALYIVLAIVAIVIGGGLALLAWQAAITLAALRASILPQLQQILTEVQKTLTTVEDISRDVDGKLHKLDSTVDEAQATVHAVAEATRFFRDGVAKPALVNLLAVGAGAKAAWQRLRQPRPKAVPLPSEVGDGLVHTKP
ncbi:MAG: hypothetical protein KGR26_11780 [Cyanobacteria bacterium REEB65]|nr:hypothetical protein [Cyanobacteria bacterium REEB65]